VVAEIKAAGGEAVAGYEVVTSMASGKRMVRQALDTFGRLDIQVNHAGMVRARMIFIMSERQETFGRELVAPKVVSLCPDAAAPINGRHVIVGGGEISLVSLPEKKKMVHSEEAWTVERLAEVLLRTLGAGLKNLVLKEKKPGVG
jgi:hypothetical protein